MASYEKKFGSLYSATSAGIFGSIEKAKNNKLLLDNISTWYIFEDSVRMGFSMLRKYENIIRANVVEVDFDTSWKYKPEYCSYDLYGTTDLWYFIMFLNNVATVMKFDFTNRTILVPSDEFIDAFNSILEKETRMKNSLDNPIRIYKHYLKRLDEPSKQVLPSDFDSELDGLTSLKEYKDITKTYLDESNFQHYTSGIIKGILKTEFYENYNRVLTKYKRDLYSTPNFYQLDNYSDDFFGTGFQKIKNTDDDISINKTGFLRPFKTGNYKFRISASGDYQMSLDEKVVLNYQKDLHSTVPDMNYVKNLFEEYSKNSDFKRRNEDGWNIYKYTTLDEETNDAYKVPSIFYNSVLNKTVLGVTISKYNSTELMKNDGKIFDIEFPISGIKDINLDDKVTFEDNGDIYYRVDYYLPRGKRNSKLCLTMTLFGDNDKILRTVTGSSQSYNLSRSANKLCSEVIFLKANEVDKTKIKKVKLSLAVNFQSFEDNKVDRGVYEEIYISKVYFYTLLNSYYETEDSIYLDENHGYVFKSMYLQSYDNPYGFFNVEYKYENEEYKKIPIGWFYIQHPTYNGYSDYDEKSFKELKEYYNIDISKLLDVRLNKLSKVDDSFKEAIFTDKELYYQYELSKSLLPELNDEYNTFAYFMNNMKHLIRMGIYNNDTNELIEEYYVDNFITGVNILHEFNLTSTDNAKYRMMYELPLGRNRFKFYPKKTRKYSIKSYGNSSNDIKSLVLKGNKHERINVYLGRNTVNSIDDKGAYKNTELLNYKLLPTDCSSAEKFMLLGTCNFTNSYTEIDLTKLNEKYNNFDKFTNGISYNFNDELILCGVDTLLIDVITDGSHYNLTYSISDKEIIVDENGNENYPDFEFPFYENRVSVTQNIKEFYSKDYLEMLLKISWYNTTKSLQLEKSLMKFITTEFFDSKLNEIYDLKEFVNNLMQIADINTLTTENFDSKNIIPFFSYNKGLANEMMTSSSIYHPFLPENYSVGCMFFEEMRKVSNVDNYLSFLLRDTDMEYTKGTGLYKGHFKEFLHSPQKNIRYEMLPDTELIDDFILYCTFRYRDFVHHENEQNIFSTKQGIFGITFDYKDNRRYVLFINLYKNPKYIKTGIYKYNEDYLENSYNGEGYNILIESVFRDRFKLVYEIAEPEFEFNLDGSDKKIMLMNNQGWIIIRVDGKKTSLIKLDENRVKPYHTAYGSGKLGFFFLNMDGIAVDMQLYN